MKKAILVVLLAAVLLSCFGAAFVSAEPEKLNIESYTVISGDGQAVSDTLNGSLTDGQVGSGATADLESGLWFAFETGKNMSSDDSSQYAEIVVDLGKDCVISGLRVHHLGTHPAGVNTPWGVFAEFSYDNETWVGASNYVNTDADGHDVWGSHEDAYWTELVLDSAFSARYVKFRVAALTNASKIYISELEVYGEAIAETSDETSAADPSSPLYQKSALFVGDSICEASCEWGSPKYGKTVGWAGRILAGNDMTGVNTGKSGASVSDCRGENTILAQLQAQAGNSYDYVILHGGTNDAWDACTVGTMTDADNFTGPYDMSTFAGGLETTIQYAKENYPDAIFGYIINFNFPKATHGVMNAMDAYVDVTIEICEKWDIPYLDLYHDEDFCKNQLKTESAQHLPDFIHPNSLGYNIITPVVEDWMKTLTVDGLPEEESSAAESSEETAPAVSETVSETTMDSTDSEGGFPIYGWVIIAVVAAVVIAAVAVVIVKRKK